MSKSYQNFKKDSDALKTALNPLQYQVTQKSGTEPPFQNEFWNHKEEGIMSTLYQENRYLLRFISLTPELDGLVFIDRSMKNIFSSRKTMIYGRYAPKYAAVMATVIWDTFSKTGPCLPVCVTVLILPH